MGTLSILCFLPEALNYILHLAGLLTYSRATFQSLPCWRWKQWFEECTFHLPAADERAYSCGNSPRFERGSLLIPAGAGNQKRGKCKRII